MTAESWLAPRLADAPARLRERMLHALPRPAVDPIPEQLAAAALDCLRAAMHNPSERASALDLLAADALLTHACEAASEEGVEALMAFAKSWDAHRFEKLLTQPSP